MRNIQQIISAFHGTLVHWHILKVVAKNYLQTKISRLTDVTSTLSIFVIFSCYNIYMYIYKYAVGCIVLL